VDIQLNKEAAKNHHDRVLTLIPDSMLVYTDRSGIHGKIGAGVFNATMQKTHQLYLGKDSEFTAHAAELEAMHIASTTVIPYLNAKLSSHLFILSDSQAVTRKSIASVWTIHHQDRP
jgi:hypothetical protein